MRGAVFPPLEFIQADALYVIERGVIMIDGIPRGQGKVWGEVRTSTHDQLGGIALQDRFRIVWIRCG